MKWDKVPDKMQQYVQLNESGSVLVRQKYVWRLTKDRIGKIVWE